MENNKLNSLLKYRYKAPAGMAKNSTPTKQNGPTVIPETPPSLSSPAHISRPGVLGRRGVVVIDSSDDDSSPVKKSSSSHQQNNDDLEVTISPQPMPRPGATVKFGTYNNQPAGNHMHFNQSQKQTTPQKQWTYGTPQKSQTTPNYQGASPFKQASPFNQNNSQQNSGSTSSSPWLSKTYGQQNGHVASSSRSPSASWTSGSQESSSQASSATSTSSTATGKGFDNHDEFYRGMSTLRSMFPQETIQMLQDALNATRDVELAIDYIVNVRKGTPLKRPSPDTSPVQQNQYKRIRIMSESSTDGERTPQKKVADELTFDEKVQYLLSQYPMYNMGVLKSLLLQCGSRLEKTVLSLEEVKKSKSSSAAGGGGSIKALSAQRKMNKAMNAAQAPGLLDVSDEEDSNSTSHSSEQPSREQRGHFTKRPAAHAKKSNHGFSGFKGTKRQRGDADLMSLDDDFNDDEEDMSDDDDSDEEMDSSTGEPILDFFNSAHVDEFLALNGCSKKKADILIGLRPFPTWDDLGQKLYDSKLIHLISACKALIKDRKAIDGLLQKCEGYSKRLDQIAKHLIRSNNTELNFVNSQTQLTKQPECINKEMKLKPFQMVGLNWLMLMHNQELNGILADEMGLGKTIQTIAFLAQLMEKGNEGPHCIVCPSSTVDNWLRELDIWCPALSKVCYYGSQDDRKEMRMEIMGGVSDFHVMVTTYNIATGSIEDRNMFKKVKFQYAIFDEGHMLKNVASQRYRNLMRIRAERRLLLTGTPLQNNLTELMSLLQFIMPDLFYDKQEQLKIFTSVSNKTNEARSKYEQRMINRAKGIMKPFHLRRLKNQVLTQLPKKQVHIERVILVPEQRELYDGLKKKFSEAVAKKRESVIKGGGSSMLMELRKAANHHLLIRNRYDDKKLRKMAKLIMTEPSHSDRNEDYIFEDMQLCHDYELHNLCKQYSSLRRFKLDEQDLFTSGKLNHLDKMLPEMKQKGDRVLLFSQFVMMLDILEHYMKDRGHQFLRLDGQTPVADRQDLIDKFNSNEEIFVFLLSTKAGGLGINLTAANTVILHDIDYNPHNDLQAEDRCHRVGQTKDVHVYKLLTKDTLEDAMNRCAENKLKLEEDVTGLGRGTGKKSDEEDEDVASLLQEALQGV